MVYPGELIENRQSAVSIRHTSHLQKSMLSVLSTWIERNFLDLWRVENYVVPFFLFCFVAASPLFFIASNFLYEMFLIKILEHEYCTAHSMQKLNYNVLIDVSALFTASRIKVVAKLKCNFLSCFYPKRIFTHPSY